MKASKLGLTLVAGGLVCALTSATPALAGQWVREGYGIVYGTLGGVAGTGCCGTGGGMIGSYAGQQFGYEVYDSTLYSIQGLRTAPAPSYEVYSPPEYRTYGSTPMRIKRRY